MAKSRLRPNRGKHEIGKAHHLGWSKGKTIAIIISLILLAAFILFIIVGVILLR